MSELLFTPLVVIHVAACLFLVLVILIQPGKSGGMGALASGAAQQVFGGGGAGNLLTKVTWVTGSVFFVTSVTLAYLSSSSDTSLERRARELQQSTSQPAQAPAVPTQQPVEKRPAEPVQNPAPATETPTEAPSNAGQ